MQLRLAQLAHARTAWWYILLPALVTGVHVAGWRRTGHATLIPVRVSAHAIAPSLRLAWPALLVLTLSALLSRRGRMLLAGTRSRVRLSWLVAAGLAAALLTLVVLSVLAFPGYLVQRTLDQVEGRTLSPAERLKAENDARTTLAQDVAGLLLVIGAGATWRQIQITRDGHLTERFSKAIDHLGESGDDKIDVRLGGIYALERIAKNSRVDRMMIAEILAAYVRGHAPWTSESATESDTLLAKVPTDLRPGIPPYVQRVLSIGEGTDLRIRAPDVQAVMTVLGRRAAPPGKQESLLLTEVDLRRADLRDAHLEGADLRAAHLEAADLRDAHLEGADLGEASLMNAYLPGAHLEGTDLDGAHLEGAILWDAHLQRADLKGAHLEGADLSNANLEGAELDGAHMEDAGLDGANLNRARATVHTSWPGGYEWKAAGVQETS